MSITRLIMYTISVTTGASLAADLCFSMLMMRSRAWQQRRQCQYGRESFDNSFEQYFISIIEDTPLPVSRQTRRGRRREPTAMAVKIMRPCGTEVMATIITCVQQSFGNGTYSFLLIVLTVSPVFELSGSSQTLNTEVES